MLSQHDKRSLEEIEVHLRASDPELAHQFDEAAPRRRGANRRAALIWLCVGAVVLGTALALRNADAAFLAVGILLAELSFWTVNRLAARLKKRHLDAGAGR